LQWLHAKDENIKTKARSSGSSGSTVDLEDGTYNGEAMGNNGNIGVDVTVKDGAITDIVITKFVDDKGFLGAVDDALEKAK
jgi:uncharacterized protein with FMN-binding domain